MATRRGRQPAKDRSRSISARLPNHLAKWLFEKVCDEEHSDRDYPSASQAVIGELSKVKLCEEQGLLSPRARRDAINLRPKNDHICPQGEKQCLQA